MRDNPGIRLIILLILILAGCGTPTPAAPPPQIGGSVDSASTPVVLPPTWTPTVTYTPLPTYTPTQIPTDTPVVTPGSPKTPILPPGPITSLESASVDLEDLPPGFIEFSFSDLSMEAFGVEGGFFDFGEFANFTFFINEVTEAAVMSMAFHFQTPSEQAEFDQSLTTDFDQVPIDDLLGAEVDVGFAFEEIEGFAPVGDIRAAFQMELEITDEAIGTESISAVMVMFRRESVGAFLMVLQPNTGQKIDTEDLALTLDSRIQDALAEGTP